MNFKLVRSLTLTLMLVVLALMMVATVSADDPIDPSKKDGRINTAIWLGNHAVYCIDHTGTPTSDGWSDGGIRVLDGNGQVVFFASAAEIDGIGVPAVNTLIRSEGGLSLYRQPDGGFSLNGLEEWGNPYTFVFNNCVPIGPIPYTHASIPQPVKIINPCGRQIQSLDDIVRPQCN